MIDRFSTREDKLILGSYQKKTQIELVKLLFKQIKFALFGETFAATILIVALWRVESHDLLLGWYFFIIIFCVLARYFLVLQYLRYKITEHNVGFWLGWFAFGALVSGIAWGVAGTILVPQGQNIEQTYIFFLMIGVTAAAAPFYSPIRFIYALFLLCALIPFASWLFLQGGLYILMALAVTVYIALMLVTSYYANRLVTKTLELSFKNELSLSLIRATLESATDGMLVVGQDGEILEFNQKFLKMWRIPEYSKIENNEQFINYILDQIKNPQELLQEVKMVSDTPNAESFYEIFLKDGRIYESYSQPQLIKKKPVGRVWSFRDITKNKRLEKQLTQQATHDSLTELPNRFLWLNRMHQHIAYAKRFRSILAIAFLDLDHFKLVNDSLGHEFGDQLLKIVANRLKQSVRDTDTVARIGGDEFIIVFTSLANKKDLSIPLEKIFSALHAPITLDHQELNITVSVGVAFYPQDGVDAEVLLRNADAAMYRAKNNGRNNIQFYESKMSEHVTQQLTLKNRLFKAFEANEFLLFYQPQFDLKTHRIIGVEVLVRWQHPELGLILPIKFISIAEESGLIVQLGEWVLRTACQQYQSWLENGVKPIELAVNISELELIQADYHHTVSNVLRETHIEPKYLALEIAENVIMDDIEKVRIKLQNLKTLGLKIVIDNFGMSYSSLSYLKMLPIDKIKIGEGFLNNMPENQGESVIIGTMIKIAKRMDLIVLGKGVEKIQQLNFLREHDCDQVQGNYFSPPLDLGSFEKLLRDNQSSH